MRNLLIALLGLAAVLSGTDAFAHGRRGHVHFYWGPAWYWGPAYYYPPPVYYYPAPVRQAEPKEYIERIDPAETGSWYYCEDSRGYYPYVKDCPAGWRRVPVTPPATSGAPG